MLKHVKKMMLVPAFNQTSNPHIQTFEGIKPNDTPTNNISALNNMQSEQWRQPVNEKVLSDLDKEIIKILQLDDLPDDIKLKYYLNTLKRFLDLRDRLVPHINTANILSSNTPISDNIFNNPPTNKLRHRRKTTENDTNMGLKQLFDRKFSDIPMPESSILKGIHFSHRAKAAALLNKMSKINQKQFRWNSTGLVFINEKKVPYSNMKYIMANLFLKKPAKNIYGLSEVSAFLAKNKKSMNLQKPQINWVKY